MIIDDNIISLLQFNNKQNLSYDLCENIWNIYNPNMCLFDNECKKFGISSCKFIGYGYLFTNNIDLIELFKNNFTIDFWVYINNWVHDGGIFSCSIKENDGISLVTDKENNTLKLIINSNNQIYKIILKETLNIQTWHHVIFSKYDNNIFRYFINGELKYEIQDFNIVGLSNKIILGNYHYINPNSDNFKGNIDEFIIRNNNIYKENTIIPPNSEYVKKSVFYFNTSRTVYLDIKTKSVSKRIINISNIKNNKFNIKRKIIKNYKIFTYYLRRKVLLGDLREFGKMNITIKYNTLYHYNINYDFNISTINKIFKKIIIKNKTKRKLKKLHLNDTCRSIKYFKLPKFTYFVFNNNEYT